MHKLLKGFTLIELLVTIGVLAVIAAGVVALINPADKLAAANDANAINAIGEVGTAATAYAAVHNALYPSATTTDLANAGDLTVWPTSATNGTFMAAVPAGCATGGSASCTAYTVYIPLKSKKYTVGTSTCGGATACSAANAYWIWNSSNNKAGWYCGVAPTSATACP